MSMLIGTILLLAFGWFVYARNRKSILNIIFLLICFLSSWWQFFVGFLLYAVNNNSLINYFIKIGYAGIIFIPVIFFHFILIFLGKISKKDKYLLYSSYSISIIFLLLLATTNYFINGFYKYWWGFCPRAGIIHPLFVILTAVLSVRGIYLLYFSLKKEKKEKTNLVKYFQTKYILLASLLYIISGQDFLGNYGISLNTQGGYFILAFLAITAYAIVKFNLFGIKLILTEILVGLMGVAMAILPFLVKSLSLKILTASIFFLFSIVGYLLIRYTRQEIHQREILEKMVKERTRDLEKAKNIAEEKTREVEEQKADLERFYKLSVGHELKIVELKNRIKELEEKSLKNDI